MRLWRLSPPKATRCWTPSVGAPPGSKRRKLGRRWIGIDIAIHAVKHVAAVRLRERLKLAPGKDFTIEGVPRDLEGAQDLWERDKYNFQKWAVEAVDGFATSKRTADGGIDGRIYFEDPRERDLQSMVLEVKGGKNVTIADLRALHSVLEREEALVAELIIMHPLGACAGSATVPRRTGLATR